MKRFFRKALIGLAKGFAILFVVVLIFYAEEDWRGAHDWAVCQKELQAKGEILDLRQLVPPGKPEDDLSKVPIFAELYQNFIEFQKTNKWSAHKPRIRRIKVELEPGGPGEATPGLSNYLNGVPIDLTAWQTYYRSIPESHLPKQVGTPAQDVLQALSQFDPELNEIDAAVSNPNAFWPSDYERPFETFIGSVTGSGPIANVIRLRAVAHLDNHQADLAEKDYLFLYRLYQPLTKSCFVVNYLVMTSIRNIDDVILWEGLHRHAWNVAQLREMESAQASMDMLALGANSFRIDRAAEVQVMKGYQGGYSDFRHLALLNEDLGSVIVLQTAPIRPSGWWNQDQTAYSNGIQARINAIDLNQRTLFAGAFPSHVITGWGQFEDVSPWSEIYTPVSALGLLGRDENGPQIARAEAYRRLARLACRLEEYRLAHGPYPDKLDDLPDLPAHLNQEVLSEEPLRYQRKGDGYQLYSVGWDQKDDGGVLATDDKVGDWPWPSP